LTTISVDYWLLSLISWKSTVETFLDIWFYQLPDAMRIFVHTVYCLDKRDTQGAKFRRLTFNQIQSQLCNCIIKHPVRFKDWTRNTAVYTGEQDEDDIMCYKSP